MRTIREVQQALADLGFDPGPVDGIRGPQTDAAIVSFKRYVELPPTPYVGSVALSKLFNTELKVVTLDELPWITEITKYMGYHEVSDNKALREWLKSDGGTLGDPSKLPWCGDAIQTALKLALTREPWEGRVGINPYLARNWVDFGDSVEPCYGSIGVFWRGSKEGLSGHVAFIVGKSSDGLLYRVRGGNQANSVNDTWIKAERLLATRWPATFTGSKRPVPVMNSKGAIISTNEG